MRELMNKTWRSRITILMTFASSLVVTALSAMKVYLTWRDRILMIPDPDWTYSLDFCITHGEAVTGIIVACLPTLRGLLSRGLGLSNTGGENSSTGYYRSLHQQSHSLHMSRTAGRRTGNTTTISSPGAMETGGANNEEYLLKPHDVIVTTVVEARRDSPTEETERHSVKDIDQASGTSTSDLIIQGTDVKGNTPSPIPPFPRAHLQDRTRSRRTSQGGWS
ncbi:hypothetical protein AJ80_04439 [Polytolypa hystricis UAMH7299]|uniref:Rhodopsin domain-containing protein n=1 Tax=Polytolypa hystricis (strain UAMH7299) TaxID=1447883 RepID=A0A2B7YBK0_POLH7|nr:hypothetical protein AJ80_04439 [Polytolypa hystricis UAMH7299]